MKTSIQVIFFDAAETLFHIKGSVADIYLTYAVRHGFRQSSDSHILLAQAFQRAFHDASPPVFAATDPIKLKQCERLWWFDIVHNVFSPAVCIGLVGGRRVATLDCVPPRPPASFL